jgi:two-component system LytT family sensor kinase
VANDPHGPLADPELEPPGIDLLWVTTIGCGAAIAVGTAVAAQVYLSMLGHGHAFLRMLGWQITSWIFWGLTAPLTLRLGAKMSPGPMANRLVRAGGVGLLLGGLHAITTAQATVVFNPFMPLPGPSFAEAFIGQLPSIVVTDALIFVLLLVAGNAVGAHHRAHVHERREARLEVELARAQLDALRLEIHPHFLFNTLNSITALIRVRDNARALDMVIGLSELMRATVDGPRDHLVPLSTEISFVQRYVDLQRARFADRLDIQWDIDDATLGIPVPTLLLQPLVENAIRHGVALRSTRSRLTIRACLDQGRLRLTVADDGAGLPTGFDLSRNAGTGLTNTTSRLKQLYGAEASFTLRGGEDGGTVAEVIVPCAPAMPVRTIA